MQKDRLRVIVLFLLTQINKLAILWKRLKHSSFYKVNQKIVSLVLLIGRLLPAIWATSFTGFYLLTTTGVINDSARVKAMLWIPLLYFSIFLGPLVIYFSPILVLIAYIISFKAVKSSMKSIDHTT